MKCTVLTLSLSLLPLVFGAEYLVGVGKDETTGKKGIGFDPSVIHPAVGDTIVWEFRSGQHSVVQSTFQNPCTDSGGINTGVHTVSDDLTVDAPGLPRYEVTVNSTDPLWFFDEAGGLCNKGAILAVNPTSTQTAAAFKENAAKEPASPPPSSTTGGSASESDATNAPSETSPGPSSPSNAAGKVAQSGGLLLGALSFLVFGML
ncbi:hypothetical protein D9615_007989 [Tricholomella constricta]|uniref:Phytocyanin domain-containing protein n=1 Tax=Tricholomella constricta TaxID=117010 RepID=A0A8H5LZQ7_9AGAR|nr:hypothetical protein D9615_007989 [Tricholomella constricta]